MILKLQFALVRYSGVLINYEKHGPCYFLLTAINLLNVLNFIYPIGHFMVQHLDNLDAFTNSFGAFCSMTTNLLKTGMFLCANRKLRVIMDTFNRLAGDKRRSNHRLSALADQQSFEYLKKFLGVVYFSVVGISISPLLAMVVEYCTTGRVVDSRWDLPFKSTYFFFDVTKSPFFEIAYAVSAIGITTCAHCMVGIDAIFMGLCLHTVALFKDLKENLQRLDEEKLLPTEFHKRMSRLVDYHNVILDLVTQIGATFSRLFFAQFVGTIFILCSQSYLGAMNIGRAELISNITFYGASATQFFVYTNFGDLLLAESFSVGPFVAGLSWYEKRPKQRLFYQLMMLRSQSYRGLSFLHWIQCNRKLFLTVILTGYNVFAVLQNVRAKN